MTTEQILDHIREVCVLKKLEFGCDVKIVHGTYQTNSTKYNIGDKTCLFIKNNTNGRIELQSKDSNCTCVLLNRNECEIEIIGLPVHLEHLLYVIKKNLPKDCLLFSEGGLNILNESFDVYHFYDLTKSVEQNLNDNDELRELITNLIK